MNWHRTFDGRVIDTDGDGPLDEPDPAWIYLNADTLRPVFDGRWHRVRLDCLPSERLMTPCGNERPVAFADFAERTAHGVPTSCQDCDNTYRAARGIAPYPGSSPRRAQKQP